MAVGAISATTVRVARVVMAVIRPATGAVIPAALTIVTIAMTAAPRAAPKAPAMRKVQRVLARGAAKAADAISREAKHAMGNGRNRRSNPCVHPANPVRRESRARPANSVTRSHHATDSAKVRRGLPGNCVRNPRLHRSSSSPV